MIGRRAVVRLRFPAAQPIVALKPLGQSLTRQAWRTSISRAYATPGRPKSVVGEPTKSPKRKVKKATTAANSDDLAGAESTAQTKVTDDGKPAEKVEKVVKKATKSKKSKSVGRPRKVGRPKKVLNPEVQAANKERKKALAEKKRERAKAAADKADLKALKVAALQLPRAAGHSSSYAEFLREKFGSIEPDQSLSPREKTVAAFRQIMNMYRALSETEREVYAERAKQQRAAYREEQLRWVLEHSVEQIAKANEARSKLRRLARIQLPESAKRRAIRTTWAEIPDARQSPKPLRAHTRYMSERLNDSAAGFEGLSRKQRFARIAQDWQALDAAEKEKYNSLAKQELEQYRNRFSNLSSTNDEQQVPVAAAAAA